MEEKNQLRRPRRSPEENPQKNESLVYGKNPVTELLKSGSGVDAVLIAEGLAPAVAAYYTALAKEAGVVMTSAGATYPYGHDPLDSNIRVAPSLPPVEELEQAMAVFCCCLKLAALEKSKK